MCMKVHKGEAQIPTVLGEPRRGKWLRTCRYGRRQGPEEAGGPGERAQEGGGRGGSRRAVTAPQGQEIPQHRNLKK